MGFIEDYRKIYENIQKTHPDMSRPERKKLMAHILNDYKMPTRFSEERMVDIVNHMLYRMGKKLLKTPKVADYYEQDGHAYEPGFIDLPDAKQREARREKSKAVRLAMIDIAEEEAITLKEVARTTQRDISSLPTDVIHLFRLAASDASPAEQKHIQEYNAEIADLFGNKVSRQARRDKLVREHNLSQADAEAYLRRRRAQIVMDQVRSVMSDLDNLDSLQASLQDPALPANQLAENAKKIEHLQTKAIEMDNLLSRIPTDFILTEEDMKLAEKVRRQQNACVKASKRVHAMASPVYEYLDADMLQGLKDFSFYEDAKTEEWEAVDPWDNNIANPDELNVFLDEPQEQEQELDAENARYLEGTGKNADDMFIDDLNIKEDERSRKVELENVLQSYGFSSVAGHRHYSENSNEDTFTLEASDATVDAMSDAPFAMEWKGRYGVFQHTADGFQAVAPETLVNYGMSEKHKRLKNMIGAVSVPNGPGREEFTRLKNQMKGLGEDDFVVVAPGAEQQGALGTKDENGYFKTLAENATAYLVSVDEMVGRVESLMLRPSGYKPTSREQRTLDRVRVARAIRSFAQTKQKELELLEKARSTMAQYDNLLPEQQPEQIAEKDEAKARSTMEQHDDLLLEQRLARIAKMDEDREIKGREEYTGQWLKNKIRDTYIGDNARRNDIPESISQPLRNEVDRLDPQKLEEMIKKEPDRFNRLLGRMVAAELIMLEDSNIQRAPNIYNPKGILRAKYENADDSTFWSLGLSVRETLDKPGRPLIEWLSEVKRFDPKKCAEEMLDDCYRDEKKSPVKVRLEGRFVAPVHQVHGNEPDEYERAVEKFAEDNILKFEVHDIQNAYALIAQDRGLKLLADCVIISLILKEREMRGMAPDHGTLESMLLRDPDSVDALRNRIMKDDWFTQVKNYRGPGSITATNVINYLDANVPQEMADAVFRAVVDERNDQLYANTLHELQAQGLQNPTFRKMDGEALDPSKRTDLEYIVSGRTLYATEGDTEVLFHADANLYNTDPGVTVFHAVNTAVIRQLQREMARIPGATITRDVGNPFSSVATPDKVLDLNTTEGMQYVVDGKPFIVSDGTNLTTYQYDAEKRSFNTYHRPYKAIVTALQTNGFSGNLSEIAFNKPDGTRITVEEMNDPTSRNFQYMVSGRPFYVTANGGHQMKFSYRENENRRYFEAESTAHNSLMEFLSGNSEYNMVSALQQIYDLSQTGGSIAKSEQYDALVNSVDAFNKQHRLFKSEPFMDPLISQHLHEMADTIAQAADTFLNGEGYKTAQKPRRKVAEYARQAALELNQHLERENHERLIGKGAQDYSEIRDENLATHIVPEKLVHERPKHDYAGAAARREELVTWLRGYQNYMNTLENEIANGVSDEIDPGEVAQKLDFDPDKYTAEDLTNAGIDGGVLTVDEKRENFLKNEDDRLKDVQHQVVSTDHGFSLTTQSARRKMVVDWLKNRQNALKKQHSDQASVREEFVKWIYDTLPDFAKSLTDKNVGDSKVEERTNRFLETLGIDHHVLDAYDQREHFVRNPEPEVEDINALQVEWLINPINPNEYTDARTRTLMQEFSKQWTSNAQREEFLNRHLPGSWKEKMTDEGIAYRDFKKNNNLTSLLSRLDQSPMPRVGFTQLKLFVDQYASVLNSMDSLSKANIMKLREALDALRVETKNLSERYKNDANVAAEVKDDVCPMLDQMVGRETSQIVRLNKFESDMDTVKYLNPEQQAIADRKYSILKDWFETRLIPAMERVDASNLSFINKVKLSKAVDNLRDCFDEAESLTSYDCGKLNEASFALWEQMMEIGEGHEALADLEAFNDMVDDVTTGTIKLLDVADKPDEEPQDEKMPFSNFRKNRILRTDEVLDDILVDNNGKSIDKNQLTHVGQADYEVAQEIRLLLQQKPNENTLDRLRKTAENFVNRVPGLGNMAVMTSKMLAFCNELLDMLPSVAPPAGVKMAPQEEQIAPADVKMAPAEEKQPVEPANKAVIDTNLDRAKELAGSLTDKDVPMQYQTLGVAMQRIVADMENPLALDEFSELKPHVEEALHTLDSFIVAEDEASEQEKAIVAANKKYLDNYGLKSYLDTLSSEINKAEAVRDFKYSFKGRYKLVVDGLRRAEGTQVVGNDEAIGAQMAEEMALIAEYLDALSDAKSVDALRESMELVRPTYESLKASRDFKAPELDTFFNDMSEALNGLEAPVNQVAQPVHTEKSLFADEDLEKDLDNGIDYRRVNRLDDDEPVEQPEVKEENVDNNVINDLNEKKDEQPEVKEENVDNNVINDLNEKKDEQPEVKEEDVNNNVINDLNEKKDEQPPEVKEENVDNNVINDLNEKKDEQPEVKEENVDNNVINDLNEQQVVNQPVQQQAQPNNEAPNPAQQAVQMLRELNDLYNAIINTDGMEDIKRQMDENIPGRFESSRRVFTAARDAFAAHIQNMQNPPALLDLIHVQVQTHADVVNENWQDIVIDDNAIIELMQRQEMDRTDGAETSKNLDTIGAYNAGHHKNADRIRAAANAGRMVIEHRMRMNHARNLINGVQALLEQYGIADRMDELCQAAMDPNVKLEDIRHEVPAAQENVNAAEPDLALYENFANHYATRAEALRDQLRNGNAENSPQYQMSNMLDVVAQNLRTDNPTERTLEVLGQNYESLQKLHNVQKSLRVPMPEVEQFMDDFTRDFIRVTIPQAEAQQVAEEQQNIAEPKSLDALKTEAKAIVEKMRATDELPRHKILLIGAMNRLTASIGDGDVNKWTDRLYQAIGFAKVLDGVYEVIPELQGFLRDVEEALNTQKAAEKAEEQKPEAQAENVINEQKAEEPKEDEKVEEQKPEAQAENVINEQKAEEPKEDEKVEAPKKEAQAENVINEQKVEAVKTENIGNNVINDLNEQKDEAVKTENIGNNVINDLSEPKPEAQEAPQAVPYADFRNKFLPRAKDLEAEALKLTPKELKEYAPGMLENIQKFRTELESTNLTKKSIHDMWLKAIEQNDAYLTKKTIPGLTDFYTNMMVAAVQEIVISKSSEDKKSEAAELGKPIPTIPDKQKEIPTIPDKKKEIPTIPDKQKEIPKIPENKIVNNGDAVEEKNEEVKAPYADLRSKFLPRAEQLKDEMDKQTVRQTQRFMMHHYTPDTIKDFVDGVLADLKSENLTKDKLEEMRLHAQNQATKITEGESRYDNPSHGFPGLADFLDELTKGIDVALSPEPVFDEEPWKKMQNPEKKFWKKLNGDGTLSLDELKEYYQGMAKEQHDTLFNFSVFWSTNHSEEKDIIARVEKLDALAEKLGEDMKNAATLNEAIQALSSFVKGSNEITSLAYDLEHATLKNPLDFIKQTETAIPKMKDAVLGKSVLSPQDTKDFRSNVEDFLSTLKGVKEIEMSNPDRPLATSTIMEHMDKLYNLLEPMEYPTAANIDAWRKEIAVINSVLPFLAKGDELSIYNDLIGAHTKYLDGKADLWSFISKKPKAPNAEKNAFLDDKRAAREFYKAADSLLELEFPNHNLVTQEIDAKLAELLAKNTNTRAYELCIAKKNDSSNRRLQNSNKMKDLALYATMKAMLLNDQLSFGSSGYLAKLTEKLSAEQQAAKGNEKKKYSAETLKKLISETKAFQDKFGRLNNKGMYNFIVKREYKELAVDMTPVLYDTVDALKKKGRNTLQKDATKQKNATKQKEDVKKIKSK